MKKLFLIAALCCAGIFSYAQAQLLAFPTAEGFGRFTKGGRDGEVHYVTKLTDCSDDALEEGTLRWAIRHDNGGKPRTILFKVGGTINLTSKLKFEYPNVSILGQSAPGGGICVKGANIYVCKSNVIIRYIRFRAGDEADSNYSALDIENVQNVIIDHCSFSWSMEENVTMYDNKYTTMQWCILSEPLYYSRHQKGQRGYGAQWGGEHSSFHHNLFAHCFKRTPQMNGARSSGTSGHDYYVDCEIINNVMYNSTGGEALYGGMLAAPDMPDAYCRTNLVNNYFKAGPATKATNKTPYFVVIYHNEGGTSTGASQWYVNGNKFENNTYAYRDFTPVNNDNWLYASINSNDSKRAISFKSSPTAPYVLEDFKLNEPSDNSGITQTSADQAYIDVCKYAGAQLPKIDEIDARILAEARGDVAPQFKGANKPTYIGIIDSQKDITLTNEDPTQPGWTDLRPQADDIIPEDTDNDGMPDEWENENGLDPNIPDDRNNIAPSGYTMLEEYLNSITAPTTAIKETARPIEGLRIYPNPAENELVVEAAETLKTISIYAANGMLIEKINSNADKQNISTTDYPSGIYSIKIESASSQQTLKFLKK